MTTIRTATTEHRAPAAAILSIGDELLIGQVVNTNASWLGDRLTASGYRVTTIVATADLLGQIRAEIERLATVNDLMVVSGGLGPTHDDVTREAICQILQCELRMDEEQLRRIEQRFAERGIELNQRSREQALVPSACDVIPNEYGSAPGLEFRLGRARVVVLPGVPSELKGIFIDRIVPGLASAAGEIEQTTFLIFGPTESALADMLAGVNELLDESVTLAYLPAPSGIRVRAMRIGTVGDAAQRYASVLERIRERAGEWIVAERDEPPATVLGRELRRRGLTLGTAESCTGGMIGSIVTETPGSSEYYRGGIVSYDNGVKVSQLGVPPETIERHGAVSEEVAVAMAEGARRVLDVDIAIAVTGIAGPGGGSPEKPVGTVWIAVATAERTVAKRYQLGAERPMVRTRSAYIALDMARREVLRRDGDDGVSSVRP